MYKICWNQALTGIIETFPYFALSSLFPSNYFWDIWIKPLFTLTVVDCFNYKPALAGIITLVWCIGINNLAKMCCANVKIWIHWRIWKGNLIVWWFYVLVFDRKYWVIKKTIKELDKFFSSLARGWLEPQKMDFNYNKIGIFYFKKICQRYG